MNNELNIGLALGSASLIQCILRTQVDLMCFTMKSMKRHEGLSPESSVLLCAGVRIQLKHAAHASQFLTM